ncbi:reverse transcriptase domain-containing protein [Tanacetum coccineum]
MIKDRQFDGRAQADLHKHIAEFIEIYGPSVITTWEEMRQALVSRFFPPVMFDRLMGEIRCFTQHPNESLVDAWLRMKDLLRSCHEHGLGRGTIIQIFYYGLDEATQAILDTEGIFLYKTPKKHTGSDNSQLMEKMEALTTKIDSQFKEIKGEIKEMREGCNSCGGPHPSSKCDDKPMGGLKDEESNYAYGGYRGNYYGRSSENWPDRQPRDNNRNSQPREDNPSVSPKPEK